jgi:aspartyl aminopeptidase
MERETAWKKYSEDDIREMEILCENYKSFMTRAKTERECVRLAMEIARGSGYITLDEARARGKKLEAGDCVMADCMGKSLALFQIGEEPIEKGMNILGAHVDSPRIDIKQNPLYEDSGMALLDTHYYGGIKKYQWVVTPLAMHGVVIRRDGSKVEVCIGENPSDPVFVITDLLIHLAGDQMDKKGRVVVEGEDLNVLIGNRPAAGSQDDADKASDTPGRKAADGDNGDKDKEKNDKEAVRKNILAILKDTYGIEEEDFVSAELEIVPAGPARDCGIDRSMIMAYGQDDRICAYTSLDAMMKAEKLKKTCACILVDKEEIGSVGATGMHSRFFENTLAEIMELAGQYSELGLRRAMANSRMLSSDVSAGFDPNYPSVFEKKNAAFLGRGVVFNKYNGARGKSGSNDASAEYMGVVRKVMNDNNVIWQTAEIGKVDKGGGGTIAYIMGNYGMEVIDCGIAVLNMHAPYEVASKADIYEGRKCYSAFLKDA